MRVLLFLALPLLGGTPHTGDVGRYDHAVHAVRLSIDRLVATGNTSATAIADIQRSLRSLSLVQLPDGSILSTGMPDLAADLAAGDANSLSAVDAEIDALDDQLLRTGAARIAPSALRSLDDVLRGRQFHPQCTPFQCLGDLLGSILARLGLSASSPLGYIPVPAPLVALVFLVLVALVLALVGRGALARTAGEFLAPLPIRADLTADVVMERAGTAAAGGDYRLAVRWLLLATLMALQKEGLLEMRPGMTNREVVATLQRVATAPAVAVLDRLVDAADRAWFGHLPFGADDYRRCEGLRRELLTITQQVHAA